MPAPVTFSVANAVASHQVTLELDAGHTHSRTIIVWIDGIECHLDDCHARKDGMALQGGGMTIQIFNTTITIQQHGHMTFSGVITDHDSRRIIGFILACRLPAL
jgi:hypothetical protein